jgi:hypothetical protein
MPEYSGDYVMNITSRQYLLHQLPSEQSNDGKYLKTGGFESGTQGLKNLQAIFLAGERSEPTIVTFYQGTYFPSVEVSVN